MEEATFVKDFRERAEHKSVTIATKKWIKKNKRKKLKMVIKNKYSFYISKIVTKNIS